MPNLQRRVTFLPIDRTVPSEGEETLLETAMRSGIHINASCGGNGVCGKCRVRVLTGNVMTALKPEFLPAEHEAGLRLACMSRPVGDVTVEVPLESQVDRASLARKREDHILSPTDLDRLVTGWEVDPAVFKIYLELPPPCADDNMNDLSRLMRELKRKNGVNDLSVDFAVLPGLSTVLREAEWRVTATMVLTRKGYKLINIEAGDRSARNYSIVIDVGTTTVCSQLLDLENCRVYRRVVNLDDGSELCTLAESSDYNGQISYGEDVISRIMYARKLEGLQRLQGIIAGTINGLIRELVELSGIDKQDISHLVFAGNTTMTHIALGIDPRYIMLSPYTPVAGSIPPVRAVDLGLDVGKHVHLYVFPCVASYVGGDIVAGVLGSGIFQRDEITLFMDVGTNGEIVIGNREWLTCASCSAGPAFEGGGIKFGVRAGKGAIEQVRINPLTYEPMILTIGRERPLGICGSGLIYAVSELLENGITDQNGKFRRDLPSERVREGEGGWEYVLTYAPETQIGRDIVLTESDIDNLIRAKAAIYAGCNTLLRSVGLTFDAVEKIIIAGGFGHSLDIEKAQTIGLLPDVPAERFIFVGNGSLLGARLLSFSKELLQEAERIAKSMTNIELSNNTAFMDEFVAALFLPHTDEEAFPRVMRQLKNTKEPAVPHA
jgi:uncharacterized 2Fe-2S/4Fe-4S cluster protein (DUF4445 family)